MSRDERRRDPGEFYPGGRVWSKPGESPVQSSVKWSQIEGKPDFSDIGALQPDDTTGKIKQTVNKITEKMKGGEA